MLGGSFILRQTQEIPDTLLSSFATFYRLAAWILCLLLLS